MDYLDKTLKTYKELGKDYIKTVSGLIAPEFSDFIKLLPPGGSVLDVGCTGGRDSKEFDKRGFSVTGIDLVDIFLDEARKLIPNGLFIKMDAREIDFPKENFDGIWASMVLLHLKREDVPAVLNKFHNILKPYGKLFIGLKKGSGEQTVTDKFTPGRERFFTYYQTEELRKMIEKAGFNVLMLQEFPDEAGRGQVILRAIAEKV